MHVSLTILQSIEQKVFFILSMRRNRKIKRLGTLKDSLKTKISTKIWLRSFFFEIIFRNLSGNLNLQRKVVNKDKIIGLSACNTIYSQVAFFRHFFRFFKKKVKFKFKFILNI